MKKMVRVGPSPHRIVDPGLTPLVWRNISGEEHRFVSFLKEVYPAAGPELVANPAVIVSPHGDSTLIPHQYYKHWPVSGRPVTPASGRFEPYREADHAAAMRNFLARYFTH